MWDLFCPAFFPLFPLSTAHRPSSTSRRQGRGDVVDQAFGEVSDKRRSTAVRACACPGPSINADRPRRKSSEGNGRAPPHLTCPRTAGDQRVSAPPLSRLPRRYADSLPRIPTATSQTLTQRLAAAAAAAGWRSGDSPAPCRPPQPLSRPLASAAGPGPPFASLTAVSSGAGGGNTKMPQTKGSNKEA